MIDEEDVERPTLLEEIGVLEGLEVSKGPRLLPSPEMLEESLEGED